MIYIRKFIIICVVLLFIGCSDDTGPGMGRKIAFNEYKDYYLKNTYVPKNDTTLLFHFFNKKDFDEKFVITYYHFNPVLIPESDFGKKRVLAIVKVGNNYYEINTKYLLLSDNILYVFYTADLKAENMTWRAEIPLVITTWESFNKIKFIENGVLIGEIGL